MKALYRKYRPTRLEDVVGETGVVEALKQVLKTGKISHAYIFTGPRGCGKTSVARIFAHEINGFKYELEDNYIDIIEIDAASNTGVDNIRELREKALIAPSEGKYKVYIIDEVHMLSTSAFNALLKIMEEPPEHVVFIMATTNPEKIPITITSRAQVFEFHLAEPDEMAKHLRKISDAERIKITPEAILTIVERGGGSFRDSISLLDQISLLADGKTEITPEIIDKALGLPNEQKIAKLLTDYASGDINSVRNGLKELLESGVTAENLTKSLVSAILKSPTDETLHLIQRLFTVSEPFVEAKLVVAFLGEGRAPTTSQVVSRSVSTTAAVSGGVVGQKTVVTAEVKEVSQVSVSGMQNSQAETGKSGAEDIGSTSQATSGGAVDVQGFVDNVMNENPAIGAILQKARFVAKAGKIDVYASNHTYFGILTRGNNPSMLSSCAEGSLVTVHDPKEEAVPEEAGLPGEVVVEKSEETVKNISAISAIMGGVTEIGEDDVPDGAE